MKPKIINIDQLRCNRLDETQEQFDMIKYENFNFPSSVSHHTHRHNYYMLFFCTHGTGKHLVDFEEHDIRAGQIIAMHPGQIHAWMEDKDLRGYLIFFTTAFFHMRYHNNVLLDFPFFSTDCRSPHIDIPKDQIAHKNSLFDCMLKEFEKKESDYLKALRSYLNIILVEAKRIFETDLQRQQQKDKNSYLIVRNFERLINEHFSRKHKVKDYAELLLLTPNYLNAISNKITGKPAGELIRSRIMLEAKRLLLHESLTVAEIGNKLGFEDNSYFSRFFKKYEGTSPEKFRKQMLNVGPT